MEKQNIEIKVNPINLSYIVVLEDKVIFETTNGQEAYTYASKLQSMSKTADIYNKRLESNQIDISV